MKTFGSRIRKLEDRFCTTNAKPRIWVVTNAACKLALDEDRCVEILDECGFLPTGRFGVVHLGGIPNGLNAAELEKYLRTYSAEICGTGGSQQQSVPSVARRPSPVGSEQSGADWGR